MRVRSKFGLRSLSLLLSFMMVISTAFSLSLVTSASSSQNNNPAAPVGTGSEVWRVFYADNEHYQFVMRISASAITDETDDDQLANFETRYGDGINAVMYNYPLYMQLGYNSGYLDTGRSIRHRSGTTGVYRGVYDDADSKKGTSSELYKDVEKACALVQSNNTGSDLAKWRKNHQYEYYGIAGMVNGKSQPLVGLEKGNPNYPIKGTTNSIREPNVTGGNSAYLEDILYRGLSLYENGGITYAELRSLWYLYTRFSYGADNDFGYNQDYSDGKGLGAALPEVFLTTDTAVRKSPKRMYMIQAGYCIALYLAYGIEPYKIMIGNTSSANDLSDEPKIKRITMNTNTSGSFWKGALNNNTTTFQSFVVEKLCTDFLNDTGRANNMLIQRETLMSITDYARLLQTYHHNANPPDYLKEYTILKETGYCPCDSLYQNGNDPPSSLWWGLGMVEFFQHLIPAYEDGTERTISGQTINGHTFAGWGYYEVCTGSSITEPPELEQGDLVADNYFNVATEVTYNAYLASDSNTAWDSDLGKREVGKDYQVKDASGNYIDAFGNNGHVMTDVVGLTYPVTKESLEQMLITRPGNRPGYISSNSKCFSTYADNTIQLSTPTVGTTYNLKRFGYRITDASGDTVINTGTYKNKADLQSNNVNTTTDKEGYGLSVPYSEIDSAWNNANSKYSVRLHEPMSGASFRLGAYKQPSATPTDYGDAATGYYTIGYHYVLTPDHNFVTCTNEGVTYRLTTGGLMPVNGSSYANYIAFNNNSAPSYYKNAVKGKTYNPNDLEELSKNYFYIYNDGEYYPAVYEGGMWYYCPVINISNILIQFRADYVASYSKDSTELYKSVDIPEYLLAQNNLTDEFIADDKKLYSMIDTYAFNENGSVNFRGYYKQLNTSPKISEYSSQDSSVFKKSSLFYITSIIRGLHANYGEKSAAWSLSELTLSRTDSYVGNRAKIHYMYYISPTISNIINNTDSTGKYSTFTSSNFRVNAERYGVNSKGLSSGTISQTLNNNLIKKDNAIATDFTWTTKLNDDLSAFVKSDGTITLKKADTGEVVATVKYNQDGSSVYTGVNPAIELIQSSTGTITYNENNNISSTDTSDSYGLGETWKHSVIIESNGYVTMKYCAKNKNNVSYIYSLPIGKPEWVTASASYLSNGIEKGKVKYTKLPKKVQLTIYATVATGETTTKDILLGYIYIPDNRTQPIVYKDSKSRVIDTTIFDDFDEINIQSIGRELDVPTKYDVPFMQRLNLIAAFPKNTGDESDIIDDETFLNYGGLAYVTALRYSSDGLIVGVKLRKTVNGDELEGYGADISNSYFRPNRAYVRLYLKGGSTNAARLEKRGYRQEYFTKLLTTYNTSVYQLKGSIQATSVPYVATWKYSTSALNDKKDNTGKITDIGLLTKYSLSSAIKKSNNVDTFNTLTLQATASPVYKGFVRYGVTDVVSADGVFHKNILNNSAKQSSIVNIQTFTNVSELSALNNLYLGNMVNLPSTSTQSSYDVALKYTASVHNTKVTSDNQDILPTVINRKPVGTVTSIKESANSKYYTLVQQYNNSTTSTGLVKDGSNNVYLGVYPEVIMWAENDLTTVSNKSKPTVKTDYTEVKTSGTQRRSVPAVTYSKVEFGNITNSINVLGTAVAYDTRAKQLAKSLGTADTQVLYSGSGITGAFESKVGGTLTSYALDFQSSAMTQNYNVKSMWGNSGYVAKNAASESMNALLDNFSLDNQQSLRIYNPKADMFKTYDFNKSTGSALTASAATTANIAFILDIKGGRLVGVTVNYSGKEAEGGAGRGIQILKYTLTTDTTRNTYSITCTTNNYNLYNSQESSSWYQSYAKFTEADKNTIKSYCTNSGPANLHTEIEEVVKAMKLFGSDSKLGSWFEHDTGIELPSVLKNSTGGTKSYNEDCSVLIIRKYTATITSKDNGTFNEQIPITMGPATQSDRNKYFSNGFKGFVTTCTRLKLKNKFGSDNAGTVIAEAYNQHKKAATSETVYVKDAATAKVAIPDFIIGDVPISEATVG